VSEQPIILIVEDHAAVRRSLREWLEEKFSWCHIMEAASGEQAVVMAQQCPPCVVVVDIGLPGMNGLAMVHSIRALVPGAQFVVLSWHEEAVYRQKAALAGVFAYVSKQDMHTDLLPALTALLPESTI
jgi:DNA-binding NarL/FixJ family response regulator